MHGHVRSSTGHPEQQTHPDRPEYLSGPAGDPDDRSEATAAKRAGSRRGLAIAAGALVAALAGGGAVLGVKALTGSDGGAPSGGAVQEEAGTGATEDVPGPAEDVPGPAEDVPGPAEDVAVDDAPVADGAADDAAGAPDQGSGDTGSAARDGGGQTGTSNGQGTTGTNTTGKSTTDTSSGKKQNGTGGDQQGKPRQEEEVSEYPFDGPPGFIAPQGPDGG